MLKNKEHIILLLILVGALALRIAFVLMVEPPPVILDAAGYDRAAKNIIHLHKFAFHEHPTAFTMPGYPLFLSGIYAVFGDSNFTAVRIIQAIISVLTILFIYLSAKILFNNRSIPLLSALLYAIYFPSITANQLILTEVLCAFVGTIFFYTFILALKSEKIRDYIISGISLGICCLIRPVPFLFPAFVFIFILLRAFLKKDLTRIKMQFLKFALLYISVFIVLTPWIVRNYRIFHKVVIFSTEGGNPLYWGVHYQYNFPRDRIFQKGLNEIEQNNYWLSESKKHFINEMKKSPTRYANWFISKTQSLWFVLITIENPSWRILKLINLQHFVFVLLCCLSSIYLCLHGYSLSIMLILMFIYHTLFHIPFIGIPRYLFPILPLIAIASAHGLYLLWQRGKSGFNDFRQKSSPKYILILTGIILIYFLLIVSNNFKQSSGIMNFNFHPVILSKTFGYIIKAFVVLITCLLIHLLYRFKVIKDPKLTAEMHFMALLFYAGAVLGWGPINLNGTEIAVSFESPLRGNAKVEQIIDLPTWAKDYPDNKLVIALRNSDENAIDYDMEITVNEKPLLTKKRGEKFLEKEIFLNLEPALVSSSDKLNVRINVASENSRNFPILKGTTHVYRGISLLNGQGGNLALPPAKERGTYSIGLRLYGKSRIRNVYYWRGSKRKL